VRKCKVFPLLVTTLKYCFFILPKISQRWVTVKRNRTAHVDFPPAATRGKSI
jgi:hypothetical protein